MLILNLLLHIFIYDVAEVQLNLVQFNRSFAEVKQSQTKVNTNLQIRRITEEHFVRDEEVFPGSISDRLKTSNIRGGWKP